MRLNLQAKGENQKLVLAYLEENASDVLAERINSGSKTMQDCWDFICKCAKEQAKNNCACIRDEVVFGWAIHFFEEDSIEPEKAVEEVKVEKVEVSKPAPKKSELENQQISLFDLMGGGDET